MEILLLEQHIIKNILQHQQFAKSLAELLGTHPDLFISDDVCCHSQPWFDEAAKLFHKLREGCSPDHGSFANNSKRHHWWRDLDGFQKLCETFNPVSPNSDQDLFSPNNVHTLSRDKLWELIKWSPKRKCFDLLSNSLNLFCKEMYRDQFGEFVCGYWGLNG